MQCTALRESSPSRWCISCTLRPDLTRKPNYRRWYVEGGTVFFTVVTYHRRPLFADVGARRLLGECVRRVRSDLPFDSVAWVLLPDHLHAVWSMPRGDADYSTRWKKIKRDFTVAWIASGGVPTRTSTAQRDRRERGVWQRRFFEHQVRDEQELSSIGDYIHYNPVKYGLVERPID
ncbi:MAG: REP-associated tyrosine transposase [Lacipirellulaceae bacterium]